MNNVMALVRGKLREPLVIMKKELRSYFASPIAYIVITLFLLFAGFLFFILSNFFMRGLAEMRVFFNLLPILFAIFIPAVTMKLFAEEKNTGSFETLITLPLTTLDIVVGKFLAATLLVIIMLVPTFVYCLSISLIGSIGVAPIVGGYLGAILLGATYASIGIFASSLTRNQIVSLLIAFAICLAMAFIDWFVSHIPSSLLNVFEYIGSGYHFQNIAKGILNIRDIIYFFSVIAIFLMISVKIVDERR